MNIMKIGVPSPCYLYDQVHTFYRTQIVMIVKIYRDVFMNIMKICVLLF